MVSLDHESQLEALFRRYGAPPRDPDPDSARPWHEVWGEDAVRHANPRLEAGDRFPSWSQEQATNAPVEDWLSTVQPSDSISRVLLEEEPVPATATEPAQAERYQGQTQTSSLSWALLEELSVGQSSAEATVLAAQLFGKTANELAALLDSSPELKEAFMAAQRKQAATARNS